MTSAHSPLIFLGDSLTAYGDWAEWLPEVLDLENYGVPGDTTLDVLARLHEVTARRPRGLVLMIGTNDLLRGGSVERALAGTREIAERLQARCPECAINLLAMLPVRGLLQAGLLSFNQRAQEYNRQLQALALQRGCGFHDFHARFADGHGELRADLTYDGVHLEPSGYALWASELQAALGPLLRPGHA
jgi:lysophospholipase L1-like esterase